jgi:hypothetical protein
MILILKGNFGPLELGFYRTRNILEDSPYMEKDLETMIRT